MRAMRTVLSILLLFKKLFTDAALARAGECEDVIGRQMVGAALLTAHLVALGEKSGMQPPEINSILKDIAAKSEIQEFWITELEWARLLVQYRNRFHLQPGPDQTAPSVGFLASDNGRKGSGDPGGTEARN